MPHTTPAPSRQRTSNPAPAALRPQPAMPRMIPALVGEDGELHAGGALGAEELERARHQLCVLEENFVGVRDVQPDGMGEHGLVFHEMAHRVFQPAADGAMDLFHRRLGQSELRQNVLVTAVNRRERVDDGAVKIEENRVKSGHAGLGLKGGGR